MTMTALVSTILGLRSAPALVDQPLVVTEPITPIPHAAVEDIGRANLGETLFSDQRLSHDNLRSCMSCHDVHSNGADVSARDLSPSGAPLGKNTNTVFNAALSFRLNWTGDLRTLPEQVEKSLLNPDLMATTWPEVLGKLKTDPNMVARFRHGFGREPDRDGVLEALAAYERTLVTPDSRFDLWLRGNSAAVSPDELNGYRLFKSAGCVSCHQGVNVGGNLFAKNGIFQPLLNGDPELMRVPSLRNVAVTPPYFHDGSAATLEDAVQRMGEAQLGRKFSDSQVSLIVAFLRTLTGRYQDRPLSAP